MQARGSSGNRRLGASGIAHQIFEARARVAVETADVVLLCFDSQSQQAGGAQRVSEWVHAYGKPVVAILNNRNAEWRTPTRARRRSLRRTLSQSVAEHVGRIRDELGQLGLGGTPWCALSAKRALFARAREPFVGPDAPTFRKHRVQYGVEKLARWSNLGALEDLLIAAIHLDAAGLRVAMLRRELRAELRNVGNSLGELERSSRGATNGLESLVESALRVVGYPHKDVAGAREAFADSPVTGDLLSTLEQLRESPFQAGATGELQAYVGQLLDARLSPLRTRSLGAAERAIEDGFRNGREVSSEEFQRRAFDSSAMDAAARDVIAEAEGFLARKVRLAVRDAKTDFQSQARGIRIDGGAGGDAKKKGFWLGVARVAASAFAAATIVIPPLFLVSIAVGIGSLILGGFSRRARQEAEEKRAQARREALHAARRTVNDAYERVAIDVAAQAVTLTRRALATLLVEPVRTAVALRLVAREAGRAASAIQALANGIEVSNPLEILRAAARSVEEARYPSDPGGFPKDVARMKTEWVDPEGLLADAATAVERFCVRRTAQR